MQNNLPNQSDQLIIAHLLNTIKELKTELERSHGHDLAYSVSMRDHEAEAEECSCCQAIASAKVMLALHKANIK